MIEFFAGHIRGLLGFSGREARQPFWLWVAFNMALQMLGAMALMVPMMFGMFSKLERFADAHPDQVTRTYGPGSYSVSVHGYHPELMPDFSGLIGWFGLGAAITVFLLAAAVVRRLHDCDRTGLWGLLPVPFLAAGLILMPGLFNAVAASDEPDMRLFFALSLNNLVYLAMLAVLVYRCAQPGTPGENRFGPPQ
jgi:uncharacterized membrane protein YhaH (DUF805 family)